ncbi:M48 family metalloprotease [Pseudohalioglobus sediminis]|uniref:M48 family metalloprotease n=1 Tax=Pseudohalioglobus sediminis TaxID=2606449 RepID=A0A5B0WPM2_9GAMM|nr:M48 family metalloprotease [Pseudohalioglobus sediminis]KAA1189010.1 M48 family metalloprotease [Pseudohalioglobus sediminis]
MMPFARLLLACLIGFGATLSLADSAGEEGHQKIVASGQVYEDPELQEYINRVGQRLVANSDSPKQKFTFTVLDSETINAFAAPDGFIYISRGLLPYLDSEAELAGVLAHEIGHVTANHHGRRGRADITSKIVATTAYILTGSRDLADVSTMYGAELISGYGREMELEADRLGAEYMHRTGYDPQALLQVIGVLKDQEQFQRVKAKATGKPAGTYHGLYATHPRNDKRLQEVIRKAGELELDEYQESPEQPGEFRRHLQGLVWGKSVQGQREENRYYHNKLAFTFEHPDGWTVASGSQSIVASAPDGSASLTVTLRRRDRNAPPEQVLNDSARGSLAEAAPLDQAGLKGYTAIASSGGTSKRLAVIDYNYTYLFEGQGQGPAADATLLQIIQSFRPLHPRERQAGTPRYVDYVQVPRGATFATIAASIRIPYAEEQLRLLNGMYPRGEPRTGDWIKVIR